MPDEYPFTYDGVTRDVVVVDGPGSPVIVLHELGGMSEECLSFANTLANDFRVHLPVLFGSPGEPIDLVGRARMFCVRREFTILSAGRSSPVAGWLRALSRHLAGDQPRSVGVVGMCLTGGMVFSLVLDPSVGAAVVSQPSLPWRRGLEAIAATELGDSERRMAQAAATGISVLGLRFASDGICPGARFERLEEVYASNDGMFERYSPDPSGKDVPGGFHSVLASDADQAPGARDRVRAFLLEHLGPLEHPGPLEQLGTS